MLGQAVEHVGALATGPCAAQQAAAEVSLTAKLCAAIELQVRVCVAQLACLNSAAYLWPLDFTPLTVAMRNMFGKKNYRSLSLLWA